MRARRGRGHLLRGVTTAVGALVLGLPGAGPSGAAAQERPDTLPPDSVPLVLAPIAVAVERERSAPPPVGALTLDPATLRRVQEKDPYHLVRRVGGVEVHDQGQGPGFASNVVMRGFTSDHSSDVLLVIDGVPVNLPAHGHVEGYADWNVLMSSSVSSLRVIHGNASPLYGDFALAGAVEVFTRADAETSTLAVGGSSFGDARGSFTTGARGEEGGLFVGVEGRREDGWRANADYWLGNALLRGWRSVAGGRLEGGVGLYATEWSSPGFVSVPDFNASVLQEPAGETDGGRSRRAVVHGRFARPLSGAAHLQAVGWAMASDYEIFLHIPGHSHGAGSGPLQQSGEWDDRVGVGGRLEAGWTTSTGDLVIGASGRVDDVSFQHAATLDRRIVDREVALDARHAAGAVYARWRLVVGERLGLDLGTRVDVLRHESRSELELEPSWESATNTVVSPKLGASLHLAGPWWLEGTTARGFRSPVGIIGDPARKPYLSWSHELGVERKGEVVGLKLALFRVDVENERVLDPVTLRSTGAGESTRQGVDGRVRLRPGRGVEVEAAATWNHARLSAPYADAHADHPHDVFTPGDAAPAPGAGEESRRVPGLADWTAHLGVAAPLLDAVEGSVTWRMAGPHTPIGEPGVETRTYSVLDLGTTVELGEGRELDVEVANVLDVRYVELRSSGYVAPGAPRSLRAQIRITGLPF